MGLALKFAITFATLTGFCALIVVSTCRLYNGNGHVPPTSILKFVGLTTFVGVGSCFSFIVTLLFILWRFV